MYGKNISKSIEYIDLGTQACEKSLRCAVILTPSLLRCLAPRVPSHPNRQRLKRGVDFRLHLTSLLRLGDKEASQTVLLTSDTATTQPPAALTSKPTKK